MLSAQHEQAERLATHCDGRRIEGWRVNNRVGESPCWDDARGHLWWIDVRAPQVLALDPERSALRRWNLPQVVGALALRENGTLLLALRDAAWCFDPERGSLTHVATVEPDRPGNRLNDGKPSPSGRWWLVGSMDDAAATKRASGGLYRLDAGGAVRQLFDGFRVANGIAFNRAGNRLYVSDSHLGQVWQADWDETTGTAGKLQRFCESDEFQGRPDGALVDAEDHYLSAGVSAGCLNRFDMAGDRVDRIALPCRAPTMACYGGPAGSSLFVTSLVRPTWTHVEPFDGQLLRLDMPHGAPTARLAC